MTEANPSKGSGRSLPPVAKYVVIGCGGVFVLILVCSGILRLIATTVDPEGFANIEAGKNRDGTERAVRNSNSLTGKWWGVVSKRRAQILIVDDSTMRIITTNEDFEPIEGAKDYVYQYQIIPNTNPAQINRRRISPPLARLEQDVTLHGIFQIKDDVLFICEELDGKESQRPKEFKETRDGRGTIFTSLVSWHRGAKP